MTVGRVIFLSQDDSVGSNGSKTKRRLTPFRVLRDYFLPGKGKGKPRLNCKWCHKFSGLNKSDVNHVSSMFQSTICQ